MTNLHQIIEFVRSLEKELALLNIGPSDSIQEQLSSYFETQNVKVTVYQTTSRTPEELAVLSSQSEVLAITDLDTVRGLVSDLPSTASPLGIADAKYEPILSHLKETTFTSYDTEQMLYASREIEDRARRVGRGEIHAGFQRCSVMADQQSIYTDLVQQGLAVHGYGIQNIAPPKMPGVSIHTPETAEIATMWFVIFDGGGDEAQKSALIAEERENDAFYGAWTYDPEIVDTALRHLKQTYLSGGGKPTRSQP